MSEIISKTIRIKSQTLPPEIDFIEKEIIKNNIDPLRWAIIDIKEDEFIVCASGRKLKP